MFEIMIPRDPRHADGHVSSATVEVSGPELEMIQELSKRLETLQQTTVAVLHEGFRRWSQLVHEFEVSLQVFTDPSGTKLTEVGDLAPKSVSEAYGTLCAEEAVSQWLLVTYSTTVAPEIVALSPETVQEQLREEIGLACAVGKTVLDYEARGTPTGVEVPDLGFTPIRWPFIPRFFAEDIDRRVIEILDTSALDKPEVFREGRER